MTTTKPEPSILSRPPRLLSSLLLLLLTGSSIAGESAPRWYGGFMNGVSYLLPSAERTELYGVMNPAGPAYLDRPEAVAAFEVEGLDGARLRSMGFFGGGAHTGFGVHYRKHDGDAWTSDFLLARSIGTRSVAGGIGIGWSTASADSLAAPPLLSLGALARPWRHLSLGAGSVIALGDERLEGMITAGIRPLGNELLSLRGDWVIRQEEGRRDHTWGVGVATEPFRGFRLGARYGSDETIFVGINVGFGYSGAAAGSRMATGSPASAATYALRLGAHEPSVITDRLLRDEAYMELDLHRAIAYQRRPLFDDTPTLLGTLRALEAARRDPAIGGVAIRASMVNLNLAFTWEIREKLRELRESGKKVVVYIDNGQLKQYYLASVADRIVMDPRGSIMLPGVLSGSTFYRGTLEKIGIGFDEWRFFKYKSGFENFGRDSMSAGAEEQRTVLIEDIYELLRTGVCEGRTMSPRRFDSLVNDGTYFRPSTALAAGLVDTIGRWEAVEEVIQTLEGDEKRLVKPPMVVARMAPEHDYWSAPSKIAVIYALGACAMDRGINARDLVKVVRKAGKDSRTRAIVLRVDSPGGSPLASDIVAEALKECAEKKPVVISQGSVAASGGYWLSMYGDTIMAGAPTITGSIGVIAGWVYNKGLKEKLGMSTDYVKVGEHADLPFGFSLPLMGTMLPDRNLTPEERKKAKSAILAMYEDFIGRVAEARGKDTAAIDSVARGRIWSGVRARDKELVDEIGGLYESIRVAARMAGIDDPAECTITESPDKELSLLALMIPRLAARQTRSQPILDYFHLHIEHNGQPLLLMPMELWRAE